MMYDLTGVTHHKAIKEIVEVLNNKTQNTDKSFFRIVQAYMLGKMAASMRVTVSTKFNGEVPVNIYAIAFGSSGFGKGYSINILEQQFLRAFENRLLKDTFEVIAEKNMWDLANDKAARNGTDPQEEFDKYKGSYNRAGEYPFTFDSGTSPAVRQLRNKLLLSNIGSINFQVDELGSNLEGSTDIMNIYLELYDQGLVKQKLVKNTAENIRDEVINGKTPANLLLFGTPVKVFDGSKTEDAFYSFLEVGYARRCIFGFGNQDKKASHNLTPEEIYKNLTEPGNIATIDRWSSHFEKLASASKYGWKVILEDAEAIELIRYKANCERFADSLPDHKEIQKAEISHRYFKVLKLAGAFAFIDEDITITIENLKKAILLVEESGQAFQTILNREKHYVRLAKFIASEGIDLTHADLHEALPFYKTGLAARNEMISLATAWGYKQHIIIKKSYVDGIEMFSGETLKETDINNMMFSYSDHFAYNYSSNEEPVAFDQLHLLTQAPGMHWSNHTFKGGHRSEETVIPGFNMLVFDVDGGMPIPLVQEFFKDYKYLIYTTKRHDPADHRFRVILPLNYCLELDEKDYRDFMQSFSKWLPFAYDHSADQRSRKWLTHDGEYFYNLDGKLLDALAFIPRTSKNEQFEEEYKKVQSLDNLERWFAAKMVEGNRNNSMLRFALALADTGLEFKEVKEKVISFNKKLSNKLPVEELENTVFVTLLKQY